MRAQSIGVQNVGAQLIRVQSVEHKMRGAQCGCVKCEAQCEGAEWSAK